MKKIKLYTDGSSLGNPGAGGWCALLKYKNHQKILKGGKKHTTNNEMELKAVLEGLKAIKEPAQVSIYTDSRYVANGITKWIHNWANNNWKNSKKKDIEHKHIWQNIYNLLKTHKIDVTWIKAHSGHKENEICDTIAKQEAKKFQK
ncbi:MAG: ribonuclease HI [Aquificae bacterium]|nr:ribonuclease HI [Aquificota bacterium]